VRRSERALGLSIRAGQSRGEIRRQGDVGGSSGLRNGGTRTSRPEDLVSPATYLGPSDQANHEIYAMTDHVTDTDFDEALDRAQDEANVSRANVVTHDDAPEPRPGASRRWCGQPIRSTHPPNDPRHFVPCRVPGR